MRAFLTGATGKVGREVYRSLRARAVDVRVGARASSEVTRILGDPEHIVPLDFEEAAIDPRSFEGTDALFFMTPLIENQVAASMRILDAAIEAGVPHVVRLSSRSAGWDQSSALRAWHREIEDAVRSSGATWAILRPCSFFQNFIEHQAETIRNMSAVILPQGTGLIPYVDAADLGEAAAECLVDAQTHHGQTYVLTGGRAYGAKGVAAEIGRVIGKPVTYVDVEEAQTRDMMLQMNLPPWLVEAGLAVFTRARAGGEATVDPTLGRILGRAPTTLSEFVERNREAWM